MIEQALVLVTGAGSGIGRAVAQRLGSEGFAVLAADADLEAADTTARESPGRIEPMYVDVSSEESVQALIDDAASRGSLVGVVNAAGIGSTTSTPETSLETWERVMAVNARGTFLCCKHSLPHMLARGEGSIVNIGSVAGLVGLPHRAAYCASKGAVIALTRALAVDHAKDGIRVNVVCPGTIDTPWVRRLVEEAGESLDDLRARQPIGRLGTAAEVAAAVAWLIGPDATFATGTALVLDGGLTAR